MSSRQKQLAATKPLARRVSMEHLQNALLPTLQRQGKSIERTGETLRIDGFMLQENGLKADDDVTQEQWSALGVIFRQFHKMLKWWIGDWINAANEQWGDKYTAAIELTGLGYGSLRNVAYVCGSVDLSLRGDKLTIGHGKLLAPLQEDEAAQAYFAAQVQQHGWSVQKLEEEISAWKGETKAQQSSSAVILTTVRAISKAIKNKRRIGAAQIAAIRIWLAEVEASGLVEVDVPEVADELT